MKAFPNAFLKIFKLILREVYTLHLGNIVLCHKPNRDYNCHFFYLFPFNFKLLPTKK